MTGEPAEVNFAAPSPTPKKLQASPKVCLSSTVKMQRSSFAVLGPTADSYLPPEQIQMLAYAAAHASCPVRQVTEACRLVLIQAGMHASKRNSTSTY